jgi:transcriptional regulator of acetoin/glycerol metabolism
LRTLGFRGVVDPEAWVQLRRYQWPGNVRELQNALLRATLNSSGMRLTAEDFPQQTNVENKLTDRLAPTTVKEIARDIVLADTAETTDEVVRVLRECRGNVGKAAKTLGIHRSTLYRRLEKLGIQVE